MEDCSGDAPADPRECHPAVLLVGDLSGPLREVWSVLQDAGITLAHAGSSAAALAHLEAAEFALVLVAIRTTGVPGLGDVETLRSDPRFGRTPLMLLTADEADQAQVDAGYALGAIDFLMHPVSPVALRAKVTGFMRLSRQTSAAKPTGDLPAPAGAHMQAPRVSAEATGSPWVEETQGREHAEFPPARSEDAVIHTDAQGRVDFVNGAAETLVGWSAAEAFGHPLDDLLRLASPETGLPIANPALGALRDGWPQGPHNPALLVRRDGSETLITCSAAPIRDAHGNVTGYVLVLRDLAERTRHVQRLREQQEWLRVTLSSIGDAVVATDVTGRVTFLNPVAQDLTGWTDEQARGQPLEAVFAIADAHTGLTVESPVAKVLRDGVVVGPGNGSILLAKDGSRRPIDDSAAPIRDPFGTVIGVVLIFRDVTEQRAAAMELRSSEARTRAVMETALDCIITMDDEGNVVEFNPAAEKTFGYRREALIGKELAEFIIPPALRERHRQGMAHYLATGEGPAIGKRLELPGLRADGTEFPVELAITRVPTANPPLFTAYLRDITEWKRLEQQRNTRLAVTQVLNQAEEAIEGIRGVLRAVCENLGWDLGFFWTQSEDGKALACLEHWHAHDLQVAEFEEASRNHRFHKGEGIPGSVWESGQPLWVPDVSRHSNFPRAASAARNGLHGAFAIPIVVGQQTLGVIEFFAQRIREVDPGLLELMGTVAGNLGQFLKRRNAEVERSASADRLSLALSASELGDWSWNAASDAVVLSDRAADAFGVARDSSPTWTAMQASIDVADQPRVRSEFARVVAEHAQYDVSYRITRRDGSRAWIGVQGRAAYDDADRVIGMYGVVQDITESKDLVEALRSSEERLRLALDAGGMGVWDWNVRTGELSWSDSLEPLHGLAPGTFGGSFEHFQELVHPDDRDQVHVAIGHALQTSGEFYVEFRNAWPDGSIHWIAGSGRVFAGEDGEPVRMIGIGLDVTRRKRSEQTARFLADASAVLSQQMDFDETLQKVSALAVPSFADWATVDIVEDDSSLRRVSVAHVDPQKVQLAHEVHKRFPPDPNAAQGAWNILRTGRSEIIAEITDELLVQSIGEGEQLEIIRQLGLKSYLGVPLIVRGRTLAVISFINAESGHRYDQTDLAVAEDLASRAAIAIENLSLYRELREADRRKDDFLATLAHELRNPLAPISNGLQVIRLSTVGDPIVDATRAMMERQLSQMVRLVDDLLDVSRITRDKLELRKEQVTLDAVIHGAEETSRPLMERAGHAFSLSLPPEPVYLDADPTRLSQVFANLLNNAAKYTEPNGRITLAATTEGDQVVVEVSDNGLGIPAHALPDIFHMFTQVDGNVDHAQGGLGIGLSLARRLIEMHGGTIEAHSDGQGQGSRFVVRLPRARRNETGPTAAREDMPREHVRRRILVVDDNADSALSLSVMLNLMRNETRTAHDGAAAIEAAQAFRPHMIVLDIGLPLMDGYEVCRRIRLQPWSRGMVIVALTGWGQEEDRRRSHEAGFDHHLVKPVDMVELGRLLESPLPGDAHPAQFPPPDP